MVEVIPGKIPPVPLSGYCGKPSMRKSDNYVSRLNIFAISRGPGNPDLGPNFDSRPYTCPNFQLFLGKSWRFFTILKIRVLARTHV